MIAHWKLPHDVIFGIVTFCEVQTPTIGPPGVPDPPEGFPLLPGLLLLFVPLGPVTVRRSNPQPSATIVVASAVAKRLFFVIASLRNPPCGCGSARVTSYKPVTGRTVLCAKLRESPRFFEKNRLHANGVQESGQIVAQAVARASEGEIVPRDRKIGRAHV